LEAEKAIKVKLWLRTVGLTLGLLLLIGWLIGTLHIILAPFVLSLLLSYLFHPTVNRLERRGFSRGWAIILIFAILFLILSVFVLFLLPGMIRELQMLYTNFPAFIFNLEEAIKTWQAQLAPNYPFIARIDLVAKLTAFRQEVRTHLLQVVPVFFETLAPYLFFIPLLTFFLLRDGPNIRKGLLRLVPNRYFEMTLNLQYHLTRQIRNYIRGILLDSLCVGAITATGLYLMDVRYALFLGIGYGLANLVPYFGPILGAIPGIILAASQGSFLTKVVPVILVYALAQFISIVWIIPLLMARMMKVHPLVVIVAVIVGGNLFGPIGYLIAVPATSILQTSLRESYRGIRSLRH
jgi:predicted PurR-regulated permease PerM